MILKAITVCLILVFLQVVSGNPKNQKIYLEQENSCRDVCSLCECEGFYCEDECICECAIEEEENLQCITDMKKECDKNGLEYEILLQDSAKERFLRQVNGYPNPFTDFSKNFVIMKQKREPSPTPEPQRSADPIVGAANPNASPSKPTASKSADAESGADPVVGAPNPQPEGDDEKSPQLGMAMAGKMAAGATKAAIAGAGTKLAFGGLAAKTAMGAKAFAVNTAIATAPAKAAIAAGTAKAAIATGAAKAAIATGAAKAAVAGTAAKTALATNAALAGLGTKMKANKLLFTLGAPKQDGDKEAPKPALPDWLSNWRITPVLGAAKTKSDSAPKETAPSPAPPADPPKSKFFTFGPVQPAHLMEDR